MTQKKTSNRSAWVQLYEARQAGIEIESRSPGRPALTDTKKKSWYDSVSRRGQ